MFQRMFYIEMWDGELIIKFRINSNNSYYIGTDKQKCWGKVVIIFLSLSLNMCFGCPKEPSHWDGSFGYPQLIFCLRNKEINILTPSYLEAWTVHIVLEDGFVGAWCRLFIKRIVFSQYKLFWIQTMLYNGAKLTTIERHAADRWDTFLPVTLWISYMPDNGKER